MVHGSCTSLATEVGIESAELLLALVHQLLLVADLGEETVTRSIFHAGRSLGCLPVNGIGQISNGKQSGEQSLV